jgi:uncharacterized Zn finger protein (UPF0148 family)
METTRRRCPICDQVLAEEDGVFLCAEHGQWHAYGASLLVRAPSDAAKQPQRVAMPWELLVPAAV